MNIDELKDLIKYCKELGVAEFEWSDVCVKFSHYSPIIDDKPVVKLTQEDIEKAKAEEYAKLMFMSSN